MASVRGGGGGKGAKEPYSRKNVRKQARAEKMQRKAAHYHERRREAKEAKRAEWLQRNPKVVKKIEEAYQARKSESVRRASEKMKRKVDRIMDKIGVAAAGSGGGGESAMDDPLMAFADRALDEGILGSDGEYDEDRMNSIFASSRKADGGHYCESDEEISIGSADEEYLYGREGSDSEEEEIDVENDTSSGEEGGEAFEAEVLPPKRKPLMGTVEGGEVVGAGGEDPKVRQLTRTIHGLMNRLTMGNFDTIASSLVNLLKDHSRHSVTEITSDAIMASITRQANLLDSFIMTFSALIAAMAHFIGIDFVACLLEKCVKTIDEQKAKHAMSSKLLVDTSDGEGGNDDGEDGISPSRVILNSATLLCFLYDLQVLANVSILNIIQESIVKLDELDVEVLVKVVRTCGAQLRRDDPSSLKDIISSIMQKATEGRQQDAASQSSRFKFMLDTIQDLKNNRQKLVAVQHGELEGAKKVLRGLLQSNGQAKLEPLQVSLEDIRSIATKGKWWKIGAAWNPEGGPSVGEAVMRAASKDDAAVQSKVAAAARSQHMNTDVRRAIFSTLMTSEDYMDSYQRLLMLKLPSRQEREVVHVLLHCCASEKRYNPFYALVGAKFAESRHNFVVTFKYAFWDRLAQLGEGDLPLRTIVHIAKFYGTLIARRALPLSIVKRFPFAQLSEPSIVFMQVLLVSILEGAKDNLAARIIFEDLTAAKQGGLRSRRSTAGSDGEEDELGALSEGPRRGRPSEDVDDDKVANQRDEMRTLRAGLRIFIQQFVRIASDGRYCISSVAVDADLVQRRVAFVLPTLD